MRTRHWKQLVRISGGTALVDNETLKMLTFGQLLDLNLHGNCNFISRYFLVRNLIVVLIPIFVAIQCLLKSN